MKKLAITLSVALVGAGFYYTIFISNVAGIVPMIFGTLCFLTLVTAKEKGKSAKLTNDLYERSE